jgi:hypothetical protein
VARIIKRQGAHGISHQVKWYVAGSMRNGTDSETCDSATAASEFKKRVENNGERRPAAPSSPARTMGSS